MDRIWYYRYLLIDKIYNHLQKYWRHCYAQVQSFAFPVTLPAPFPLSVLFCYMDHVQNIGQQR